MSTIINHPHPEDGPGTPDPDLMPGGHMSGGAHYLQAEMWLEAAGDYDIGFEAEQWYLGAAKVHALLALAAATRDAGAR